MGVNPPKVPRWATPTMNLRNDDGEDEGLLGPLTVAAAGLIVLGLSVAFLAPLLVPVVIVVGIAAVVMDRRRRAGLGLQIDQMDQLRDAELALATSGTTEAAARQLAHHAIELLGALSATVIIEGIGDTVRVSAGHGSGSVYGPGSQMRLLDDDGVPCGSIAVSARRGLPAVHDPAAAHARRAGPARVVDPPPAVPVHRGAGRAAHPGRRGGVVLGRDLLGRRRPLGAVVEPGDGPHHRRPRQPTRWAGRWARCSGPSTRRAGPAARTWTPTRWPPCASPRSRAAPSRTSAGSPAAGLRSPRAGTWWWRGTTPSASTSRTTRTGGSPRSATSCAPRSPRSRGSCTPCSGARTS